MPLQIWFKLFLSLCQNLVFVSYAANCKPTFCHPIVYFQCVLHTSFFSTSFFWLHSRFDVDGCYPRLTRWLAPTQTRHVVSVPTDLCDAHRLPASVSEGPPHPDSMISRETADAKWSEAWRQLGLPDELDVRVHTGVYAVVRRCLAALTDDDPEPPLADLLVAIEEYDTDSTHHYMAYWALCTWCKFEMTYAMFPQLSSRALRMPCFRCGSLSMTWRLDSC